MNYKAIFKNKRTRLKILRLFDFIPDSIMVRVQYFLATGRLLSLRNPQRFTEKLQAYKLWCRDSLLTVCSDKYAVRAFVQERGFGNLLVPLIGVYSHGGEIDFDSLPNQFVLKTNNGSHTNIICDNKMSLDVDEAKQKLNSWMKEWGGKVGREWSYYNINQKIICEQLLPKDSRGDLVDYKFFCFDGEPKFLYVIEDRFLPGGIKLGIFDMGFNKIGAYRKDISPLVREVSQPKGFEKMVRVAKVLSQGFKHVRVDLYNIDGQIYFGEMTFYDGSGYKGFWPDSFDYSVGAMFQI